jgi:hypothetical protein
MSNTPDQTMDQGSTKSIHKMNETQQYLSEVTSKLEAMKSRKGNPYRNMQINVSLPLPLPTAAVISPIHNR